MSWYGLMGAVLAGVLAVSLELVAIAVAQRCVPSSPPGWSFGEVVRLGGCEQQASARRRYP